MFEEDVGGEWRPCLKAFRSTFTIGAAMRFSRSFIPKITSMFGAMVGAVCGAMCSGMCGKRSAAFAAAGGLGA
jgi:hypothetical protein